MTSARPKAARWSSAKRCARAVARVARAASHVVPPTILGWLVLLASALALWTLGIGELDMVAFVLGLAGLVLGVLASIAVAAAALVLRGRIRPVGTLTQHVEAGQPCATGFHAPSLGFIPLIQLGWRWEHPHDVEVRLRRQGGRLVETIVAQRRGQATHVVRRFFVRDVFGLARVSWATTEGASLTILPSLGKLRRLPHLHSLYGGDDLPLPDGAPDGDRIDIRRYAPGDPVRNILWKTFAKTRQLNVRTPERAIARTRKTIAYLATGPGDEAAAAAARLALESGALGDDWVFGVDGAPEPVSDVPRALQGIARSGTGSHPSGLSAFLAQVGATAHCVLFAPATPSRWIDDAEKSGRKLSFVLGADGYAPPERQRSLAARLGRIFLRDGDRPGLDARDLRKVLDRIKRLCAPSGDVALADRRSGRTYTGLLAPRPSSRSAA